MAISLRPYQIEAIERLRGLMRAGKRKVIVQCATGGGKTVVAAQVLQSAVDKGKTAVFLAHARELVNQCADKLEAFGVRRGVIMAQDGRRDDLAQVQVCSKDTVLSRSMRRGSLKLPKADLLFVDEAHRSAGAGYMKLIEAYPNAFVIGLTATPTRLDGKGLGHIYDEIMPVCSIKKLVADGYLAPVRCFAPYRPNLKGLRVTGGDYGRKELELRMDRRQLVGDIFEHWRSLASDRPTLVFASGVRHSIHLRDLFMERGVAAGHLDCDTPVEDRQNLLDQFMKGDIQVLCNCNVLTEGVDLPMASCVIMACPTKSIVKFKQQCGRGMRIFPGKTDCLLLDHSGNLYEHHLPDEDIEWSLEGRKPKDKKPKEPEKREPHLVTCRNCYAVYQGTRQCPNCGCVSPGRQGKPAEAKDGYLIEVNKFKEYGATSEEKQRYWTKCLYVAGAKGGTFKMALAMYSDQFHEKPWVSKVSPLPDHDEWSEKVGKVFQRFMPVAARGLG